MIRGLVCSVYNEIHSLYIWFWTAERLYYEGMYDSMKTKNCITRMWPQGNQCTPRQGCYRPCPPVGA